ncbi:MAG: hypothetical protein NZM43_09225 [Saprospiraceae bacterium]|nr:hypothetical protein [Saprospiraceae bacterium]MDW8484495.1 hypothetical protein [Saprospiraceae bacterium]
MKFVPAETIDALLDELEEYNDEQYEQAMQAFSEAQPYVFSYLFSEENFHLLTEDEKGYIQYLGLVIWMAVERINGKIPVVDSETIGQAEEQNYERIETCKSRRFEECLESFFEDTSQEALLSFVVEAVTEDDEEESLVVTPAGRETVFVAVKTVLDVLTSNQS